VTVIFTAQNEAPRKKARSAFLPLLIVLFVISYSLLTLAVVVQGRTIESQRTLMRELLKDSSQLADLKGKLAREEAKRSQTLAQPEAKAPASDRAPADKGADKGAQRPEKPTHSMKRLPEKPAADLEDVRRSTHVI
jgi:hypothetical protein